MKLKDKADEFASLLREFIVGQVRHRFGFNRNTPSVRCIEQTEDIQQRTLTTSGRADDSVNASDLDLKRHTAKSVHAFLFFAEIAFDPVATQTNFCAHL